VGNVLGGLCLLAAIDAFVVEPRWLRVARHEITAKVPRPLLVAHVSDLHTHGLGAIERSTLDTIDAEKPDLVVVTGDVVDDGALEHARPFFERLHPPLGTFVVSGNWESWKPTHPDQRGFYDSVGAHYLLNEAREVVPGVWIAGIDDALAGAPDPRRALAMIPSGALRIALFHSPVAFDELAPSIDLAFAGHTHGGQVRIPIFGPVWLPPGSGRYLEGWYPQGGARMHVSRGIGESVLPVRFWCRPELAFVRVVPG
jgi:predicted MPP superfamily phosphohydrolase